MSRCSCICALSAVLLTAAASSLVLGAPTGLNIIPVAEVLPSGMVSLEKEIASSLANSRSVEGYVLTQIGIGSGIEFGIYGCLYGSSGSSGNVKWLVAEERSRRPAIAIGIQEIGQNAPAQPYLVSSTCVDDGRLHLGAIAIDGKLRYMLGADYSLNDRLMLQVDHVSGHEGSTSLGAALDTGRNVAVMVSWCTSRESTLLLNTALSFASR